MRAEPAPSTCCKVKPPARFGVDLPLAEGLSLSHPHVNESNYGMLNFQVEGMSCDHCRSAVTAAIRRVAPQARVEVDLDSGQVTVAEAGDREAVAAAIRSAGYETR